MAQSRAKKENKIGAGGFKIALKNPKEFENSMKVVIYNDINQAEDSIVVSKFNTKNGPEATEASQALATVLQSNAGSAMIDDQVGKESIVQNVNSDESKLASQAASGYAIRNNLVQKMAPGDQSFHLSAWLGDKKINYVKTFPTREEGEKGYKNLVGLDRILISGETGDVVMAEGE